MNRRTYGVASGRELLIREADVDDATSLLNYIAAIAGESDFLTFGPGEFVLSVDEEERILTRFRNADNQLYLVALIDGEIVGHLSFAAGARPRVRHTGAFSMSVRKRFWGMGIGSHLIDTLIDWAHSSCIIRKIDLYVRTDNERAIVLYQSKGFVIEGTITRAMLHNGTYYDHHAMGLEVDNDTPRPPTNPG